MAAILGGELLRGDRVWLDRLRLDDVPALTRMWSDIAYLRDLMRRPAFPLALEEFEEWFRETLKDDADPTFVIRTLDGDQLIGACAFKEIRWPSRHAAFWIGIGEAAMRGQGYGRDATLVLLKYAFLELNLNCVRLEVLDYNTAARALYERIGFHLDGTMRAFIYRDGVYYDQHVMSLLRDEWEARYGEAARRTSGGTS